MKPLTQKQIKVAYIVAGILVCVHFAPSLFAPWLAAIARHRRSEAIAARPSVPLNLKMDAPSPPPTGPALPLDVQQRFLGVWDGTQMGNTNCQVHLELRPSPHKPGYIAGYETRMCYDLSKLVMNQPGQTGLADTLSARSPLATELEGTFSGGDLTFRVANSIGGSRFTCPLSSYAVLPWGTQDVIAQWKASGGCPDSQMILKRGRG